MARDKSLVNEEVTYDDNQELVSTTDLRGVITYANPIFCQVAGYSYDELVGKNHNIVRHPDMPKAAFKDLWSHLEKHQSWRGMVKNRCKDGRYYWVDAYVTPIYEHGQKVGYQSVRVKPSRELVTRAERIYRQLNQGKFSTRETSINQKLTLTGLLALVAVFLSGGLGGLWAGLVTAVGLGASLAVFWRELVVIPRLSHQLGSEYDSISRFVYAGKGVTSHVEFHLGLLKAKLRTVIGRMLDATHSLEAIAKENDDSAKMTAEGLNNQRSEVEQIATAITEMASTSQEIARNTSDTNSKVGEASSFSSQAQQRVQQSKSKVTELSRVVADAADSAEQLVQEADKVSNVMGEIEAIAEQTNLLALNAAIESARAGESGRGFSVVADEVRALSKRTQTSTANIHSSLDEMRQTLSRWVDTMETSKNQALECEEDANQTTEAIEEINRMMAEISDFSTQIATASEQQEQVCEEVSRNTNNITNIADENAQVAQSMEQGASELRNSIDRLISMAKTFGGH